MRVPEQGKSYLITTRYFPEPVVMDVLSVGPGAQRAAVYIPEKSGLWPRELALADILTLEPRI